ncbi:MAG TPA: hypothetical protein VI977_03705 [archaeon]|nr:hypothetical protein [archaeon]
MAKKTIAAATVIVIVLAAIGLYFTGFLSGYGFGITGQKGFYELGFSKNQLSMIGTGVGTTEQEKITAIRENFFVFEYNDAEKKQLAAQAEIQVKQGSFKTAQGIALEGWILRIPNIEKGKQYSFEIRIPDYEISSGQFTAEEVSQ